MKHNFLLIFLLAVASTKAQFFKGVGIFGAVTSSAHYYENQDTDKKNDSVYVPKHFYPQSHISKEFINWGAGLFLEFSKRDGLRWQTELEYVRKGARERALINPITGDREDAYVANRYTYLQWNNYLKFYNPIGLSSHWYVLAGIRLEYLLSSNGSSFPPVSGSFPKFWFSGDLALGYEFPLFKKISAFTEFHWNPDIIRHTHDNTKVRNRTFELRLGLVYRKKKRAIDDCNAPRYNGPAY